MNKKIKNIICIIILLLTTSLTVFSVYYKINNSTNVTDREPPKEMMSNSNEENNFEPNSKNTDNPPDDKQELPSDSNDSKNTAPPSLPSDENNDQTKDKPDNMPDNKPDNMPQDMPNDMMKNNSIFSIYYLIFFAEGLVLIGTIIYLIKSNLNKKTMKETLYNKDKIIIYILSVLISSIIFAHLMLFISSIISTNNNSNNMNNPNNTNNNITYNSVTTLVGETINDKEFTSSNSDENAIFLKEGTSSLDNVTVTKTGDSASGDETSFYGTNSALLVTNGANLTVTNSNISTSANGANGIFSYGENSNITIENTSITTTKDNSGGIMVAGSGTINANNLEITTSGVSSAAIRSDRGGGTIKVNSGTYKTTGSGSPSIYSTADITVSNANLISTTAEGVIIEGNNSVTLENCTLTDSNTKLNGKSTTYKNIFLYQSMSGDAKEGTSTFTSKNSNITTNNGDTFYITNTTSIINLENNVIVNNDTNGNFLRAQKDSWGNTNSNGGNVELNLNNQIIKGNIVIDELSTLKLNITNNSSYTGAINNSNTAKNIDLVLDKTSKITLTKDTYITSLTTEDNTYSNINFNGYKLYVNNTAIN